jgi:hypothetical protein
MKRLALAYSLLIVVAGCRPAYYRVLPSSSLYEEAGIRERLSLPPAA